MKVRIWIAAIVTFWTGAPSRFASGDRRQPENGREGIAESEDRGLVRTG